MHLNISHALRAGAVSLVFLGLSAGFAKAGIGRGGSAYGLSADFTVGGVNTAIAPVNPLSNSAAGKSANTGVYHKVLTLAAGTMPPALAVNAANLNSLAEGTAAAGAASFEGVATAKAISLTLAPDVRASGVATAPYLKINADTLSETGKYDRKAGKNSAISATGSIGNLTVTGTLVGGKTLKFSGVPKANKILFQSPTVTITLNYMTSTDLISCGPRCVVTPFSVRTAALQISFDKAKIGDRKVTGQINVAGADAGIE